MLTDALRSRPVDVRPDEHLTYLMAKVSHLMERRVDGAVGQVGLTLRQFSALAHIARRPGLSSSDLARVLLTSPQAVNTLVARLMTAGLIAKAPSRPRQPLVLTVTDAGAEALRRAAPLATHAESAALAAFRADELAAVRETLERLLANLGEYDATHP